MIAAAIELECAGSSCTHMWPCRRKRRGGKTELESRASSGLRTCSRDETDEAAAIVDGLRCCWDGESTGARWAVCQIFTLSYFERVRYYGI